MKKYKTTRWDRTAYGKILSSGNAAEFPMIRRNLHIRNVAYDEFTMKSGGTVFVFPDTELKKLPKDPRPGATRGYKARYLPVFNESGHSIYPITVFTLATLPISGTIPHPRKSLRKRK